VRAKLNEVCSVFGLPRKFGINGSKVSKMIYQGKVEEVRDYCETDVLNTNLVYLRLMMHRGGIDLDGYNRSIKDIITMIEAERDNRPDLGAFFRCMGKSIKRSVHNESLE
jgi:predicted PolB exonuclease-like 3'-5' exonuclease